MANPVTSRAQILDILRGFALFGVFISNLGAFSGYAFLKASQRAALPTANINPYYDFLHYAFIEGKFYSIFSLLFGIGFAVFLTKSKGVFTFYKRLFILIGFGVLHAFLLWEGDILLLYALLGLLLPLFSKLSNKTILILSVVLILSPIALDTLRVVSHDQFTPELAFYRKGSAIDKLSGIGDDADWIAMVREAKYSEMKDFLVAGFFYRWGYLIETNRFPKVFALFLIGMMIGRNRWYEHLEDKVMYLHRLRKWLFAIGFPMTVVFAYLHVFYGRPPKVLEATAYALSVIPMAFVYGCTVVLGYIHNKKTIAFFGYVGKMTLTNYIMQSASAYLFFYGTGFALFGKTGSVFFPLFAIGVYSIQTVFSKMWLQYFEFGPLEWIWRQLTYGKYIPLQKKH